MVACGCHAHGQLAYILDRLCIGRRVPGEAAVGMPLFLNTSTNTCAEPCNLSPVTMLDPCRAIIIRLSPHESFYAAWILKFLTVYTSASGSCDKNEKQTALCRAKPSQSLARTATSGKTQELSEDRCMKILLTLCLVLLHSCTSARPGGY